jgi:hypothetical protein
MASCAIKMWAGFAGDSGVLLATVMASHKGMMDTHCGNSSESMQSSQCFNLGQNNRSRGY